MNPPSRERLRLELVDRWGEMANNLDEALAEGNGEKAARLYWDLVDQAYGKTAQNLEVRVGPIKNIEEIPTEEPPGPDSGAASSP